MEAVTSVSARATVHELEIVVDSGRRGLRGAFAAAIDIALAFHEIRIRPGLYRVTIQRIAKSASQDGGEQR